MNRVRVLALLPLFLGLAHSFSWDIVVSEAKTLKFYNHGIPTQTQEILSAHNIQSITYDPVYTRVLFTDRKYPNTSISSFDLSTMKTQRLLTRVIEDYEARIAYDPVTQLLFWKDNKKIYSRLLKPASYNEVLDENLVATSEDYCYDIVVDSCAGYIYWITDSKIERARFDGSERKALIHRSVFDRRSLAIDQQTQRLYWMETTFKSNGDVDLSIESVDFNGNNRRALHTVRKEGFVRSLAVSKDFIYWKGNAKNGIWQLSKNPQYYGEAELLIYSDLCSSCQVIVTNYAIKEQTQGNRNCEGLKNVRRLCVHGTEVSGESRCECTQGYTGERCDVSLCYNFCLQGDCTISAEGQPTCRCKAGYSGERCEVNACDKHCLNSGVCYLNEDNEPICLCTAAYVGERCNVSVCNDFCLQGNCSVDTVGRHKCSCNAGYSGERCEVNACHEHCLNNGNCSLNADNKPVCQCTPDYEGKRCDVASVHSDNMKQQILQDLSSEVKQVREDLQGALQLYVDKFDEDVDMNKKCESMKNDF